MQAPSAPPPAIGQLPAADMAALIADEPVRPAQPREIVPAVLVRAEPSQELTHRPRIVPAAAHREHNPKLVRLGGEL